MIYKQKFDDKLKVLLFFFMCAVDDLYVHFIMVTKERRKNVYLSSEFEIQISVIKAR